MPSRIANTACILLSAPGVVLWGAWLISPLLLPDAPGSGMALVPFLFALAALSCACCSMGLTGGAATPAKAFNAVCNLSWPLFLLVALT